MSHLVHLVRHPSFREGFRVGLRLPVLAVMAAAGVYRSAWRHGDDDQIEADVRKLWGQR